MGGRLAAAAAAAAAAQAIHEPVADRADEPNVGELGAVGGDQQDAAEQIERVLVEYHQLFECRSSMICVRRESEFAFANWSLVKLICC